MEITLPDMVARWQAAWTSLDPDRVAALYAVDGQHMSSVVKERMGIADGTLKSREEVHAYAAASAARLKSFRADIMQVIADEDGASGRAAVEYWRILNGDEENRMRVIEMVEWRDNEITSCRVFHF